MLALLTFCSYFVVAVAAVDAFGWLHGVGLFLAIMFVSPKTRLT